MGTFSLKSVEKDIYHVYLKSGALYSKIYTK